MQALILAGGLGTRLRTVVNDRPKPMALVNGKPFLEYIIIKLKKQGIKDIILAVGYMGKIIEDYFKSGEAFGVNILYSIEHQQLGTGGAVLNALNIAKDDELLILNGDTYFDMDYIEMYKYHLEKKKKFTMALRNVDDVERYGAVELDNQNKIVNFVEKGKVANSSFINAGTYIINKSVLNKYKSNNKISMEQEMIPDILDKYGIYGFKGQGYFIDIGIPEDYNRFCKDILEGGNL